MEIEFTGRIVEIRLTILDLIALSYISENQI